MSELFQIDDIALEYGLELIHAAREIRGGKSYDDCNRLRFLVQSHSAADLKRRLFLDKTTNVAD